MPALTRIMLIVLLLFFFPLCSWAQKTAGGIEGFIRAHPGTFSREVQLFYLAADNKWVWMNGSDENISELVSEIQMAKARALYPADYDVTFIKQLLSGDFKMNSFTDSLTAEFRITGIAMNYYTDLFYGNSTPSFSYRGVQNDLNYDTIARMLWHYLEMGKLSMLTNQLNTRLPEINILTTRLNKLIRQMDLLDYKDVQVTSATNVTDNQQILQRLYQTGITDSLLVNATPSLVKAAIIRSQEEYNVLADGRIRTTYLECLNVPLKARARHLISSINYYRWLASFSPVQSFVLVNIPAATLKLYAAEQVVLQMKVVTGKPSTPTPTLTSRITDLILYPYWHVPFNIATRELLPRIKADRSYLEVNNYQVLNRAGKIIDPKVVNWNSLGKNNFPYQLRQSTGCDNALGILKLNFYNPFDVYLHDTPAKSAFMLGRRFLSHGCIRMEQPFELAAFLLPRNHQAIDTIDKKANVVNKQPVTVEADVIMPIIVWYNLAGCDQNGKLVYYEDIYHRFN